MSGEWKTNPNSPAAKARRAEYDSAEYRATRARLKKVVETGQAFCWRCRGSIALGSDWHVGHDDYDRSIIRGPEHSRCNLRAAVIKGNKTRGAAPPVACQWTQDNPPACYEACARTPLPRGCKRSSQLKW